MSGVFKAVPSKMDFSQAEAQVLGFWKSAKIYQKSLERRRGAKPFVFFEGPPTANGMPHPGHCLTRTVKDVFPRFKTMDGYYCERKAGWDTHGLPVEVEVCKELGILEGGKEAIEKFGLEKFNQTCLQSVFRYTKEWEQLTERLGFWVNLEEAYVTYHQSYVESVWWVLKKFFDEGLLYQGHKVVWWWAQGGTALSAGEVGEGYRETTDPAITVRFSLTADAVAKLGMPPGRDVSFLAWTTTPWTLSSNCALAIGRDFEYVVCEIEVDGETHLCVLSKAHQEANYPTARVFKSVKGSELVGLDYAPIFRYAEPELIAGQAQAEAHAWRVIEGDFVTLDRGTGIVHLAPAFGEDDYRTCKEAGIGFLCFVKPDGKFDDRVSDVDPYDGAKIAGLFVKDADKGIIRILKAQKRVIKHDQYIHSYPFCPRADQDPLIQFARKSWFISTRQFREQFVKNNSKIHWNPEHIKEGRFGNFLENNVDWALSRERFWGTPLPIWICEKTGHMEALSSYDELLKKPGVKGTEVWAAAKAADSSLAEDLKIHRPYIDEVTYQSPKDAAARMRRVKDVIDVWFDAGSMPFAQWGYPHQPGSVERVKNFFPADFISEAIDQTRGWFNALLVISTLVWGEKEAYPHPFKNVICLGHLLGEDGQKLSKRKRNYKDVNYLFENYGADALRWSLLAQQSPTASVRFTEKGVEESLREYLIRWYNVYSFFVIYSNLDGFNPAKGAPANFDGSDFRGVGPALAERSEMDRWILSELQNTVRETRAGLEVYDPYRAAQHLNAFMDSLSNWYVRRSRARFWGSGWSADKESAYWTLFECLVSMSQLSAPFTPYFSDWTWENLIRSPFASAPESVHLSSYPKVNAEKFDENLATEMRLVRDVVSTGLAARGAAKIKVRQPLAAIEVVVSSSGEREVIGKHSELICDELNVKGIEFTEKPETYVSYKVVPNFKILGKRLGKEMGLLQAALKTASGAELYRELRATGAVSIVLPSGKQSFDAAELEVRLEAKDGFAAEQGKASVVILSTQISPELKREGLAKDLVRAIQSMRKEMRLDYNARIRVGLAHSSSEVAEAIREFSKMISGEVLAESLAEGLSEGMQCEKINIEGDDIEIGVATV
ncbi:MAG TPA: isoleucine--tRNA ligase [Bdellovibrionota bacterium]|jgi:isoleucyl-tRNA synthetase|nr:isoleucine--tRNA ligase [Bdellovibrionota bacterium]